jgi:hypothetical protein
LQGFDFQKRLMGALDIRAKAREGGYCADWVGGFISGNGAAASFALVRPSEGMAVPAPLGQMRERRARKAEAYLMYVAGAGGRSLTKQMVRRRRRFFKLGGGRETVLSSEF